MNEEITSHEVIEWVNVQRKYHLLHDLDYDNFYWVDINSFERMATYPSRSSAATWEPPKTKTPEFAKT